MKMKDLIWTLLQLKPRDLETKENIFRDRADFHTCAHTVGPRAAQAALVLRRI